MKPVIFSVHALIPGLQRLIFSSPTWSSIVVEHPKPRESLIANPAQDKSLAPPVPFPHGTGKLKKHHFDLFATVAVLISLEIPRVISDADSLNTTLIIHSEEVCCCFIFQESF